MIKKLLFISFTAIVLVIASAQFTAGWADTVYLKSGRAVEGIIVDQSETCLYLKISVGVVTISMDEIKDIKRAFPEDNEELEEVWEAQKQESKKFYDELTEEEEPELPPQPDTADEDKLDEEFRRGIELTTKEPEMGEVVPDLSEKPKIEVKSDRIYVNDELYFIKGMAYGINYPRCFGGMQGYRQIPPSVFEEDFKMMEEAGVNTIRTYEPMPDEILDLAQKHNIMVIENIIYPNDATNYESEQDLMVLKRKAELVVEKHKNHPAILMWSIWNDAPFTWGKRGNVVKRYGMDTVNDFLKEIYDHIKTIDKSHPITGSNMLNQEGTEMGFDFLDVIGVNAYIGGHGRWINEARAKEMVLELVKYSKKYHKPVVILETGYSTYLISEHRREAQDEVIEAQIKITGQHIAGIVIFQWSDGWWKAGDPKTHDKHIEEHWGVVTGFREPKDGYYAVKELFNQIPTNSLGYKKEDNEEGE